MDTRQYERLPLDRPRELVFFPVISALLVVMLILSNFMSSAKFISLSWIPGLEWVVLSASAIVYPFVFLGGDILTEVYGYSRARITIWTGFLAFLISTLVVWLVGVWPAAPPEIWNEQAAYDRIFGSVPRILLGSFFSYLAGEFANSFFVARTKVLMYRWFQNHNSFGAMSFRFVGSTFVGELFDSVVFFPIAFYGTMPNEKLALLVLCSWLFKTTWEALFLPVSVPLVRWLKRVENQDYLDVATDFRPWKVELP